VKTPLRFRRDSALFAGLLSKRRRARRGDHEKGREQQSGSHFRPPVRDRAWAWTACNRNGSGALMFRLSNESVWSAQRQRLDPQAIRFIERKCKRPDRLAIRASCVTIARQPP
jgi:hypothetical protein